MITDVPINFVLANLPAGANYTPQQYAQAIVDRLTGTISGGNFIFGQLGGIEPTSPLPGNGSAPGVWSPNGTTFYSWNAESGKYLPNALINGQLVNGVVVTSNILCGALQNRTNYTPDKDGTLAITDDIPFLLAMQTLGGAAPNLDWTLKKPAYYVLPSNATMTMSGMVDGQVQDLFVENNITAYTLTISGVSGWFGGTAPTFTTATAGHRKIDHVQFRAIGTGSSQLVLGEIIKQNADIALAGGDTTAPTVSSITGIGSTIIVTFNELVQGGTLNNAGFTVRKNGNSDAMVSATASGRVATLTIASSFAISDTVTVQYTGSDVKDIAGNAAVAFGPSAVTYAIFTGTGGNNPPDHGTGGHQLP